MEPRVLLKTSRAVGDHRNDFCDLQPTEHEVNIGSVFLPDPPAVGLSHAAEPAKKQKDIPFPDILLLQMSRGGAGLPK